MATPPHATSTATAETKSGYPNGACPPEIYIKAHIRTSFREVGPQALTMKILKQRLAAIYTIDFKEHTSLLHKWVEQVCKEPATDALLQEAHAEVEARKATAKEKLQTPESTAAQVKTATLTQQELKQQGNVHFQNDDFEKAIEFYTLAIEKDAFCDEAAPILSNRSLCYYNLKKFKEAYEDAGCCCGIRPDWAKGFARRGAAAEELGEFNIALESYDEYLKLDRSDEMDINSKRNRVKKIVEANEATERRRERDLAAAEKKLVDGRLVAQDVLYEGCQKKDIQRIELAVKYGANLSHNRGTGYSMTAARLALKYLHVDEEMKKLDEFSSTALLVKQLKYLERLFDLCREQQTPYEPDRHMVEELAHLLFSCDAVPLRKDIFLLLLEKGKIFFLGETASEKEFRIAVVNRMMFARERKQDQRGCDFQSPLTGDHLRHFRECIEVALKGLTNEDIKSVHTVRSAMMMSPAIEETFLENALNRTQAAEIAECFLKRGADPGQCIAGSKNVSVLEMSIIKQYGSCARILMDYGAKLPKVEVDDWVLNHQAYTSSLPSSSVLRNTLIPQKHRYTHLKAALNGWILGMQLVQEEPLRLLFDTMTEQNLGLFFTVDNRSALTPLIFALGKRAPIDLLELLLKIRPKLANTPQVLPIEVQCTSVNRGNLPCMTMHPLGSFLWNIINKPDAEWEREPSSFEYVKACVELLLKYCNEIDFDTTTVIWLDLHGKGADYEHSLNLMFERLTQAPLTSFGIKLRDFCKERLKKKQ